MDASYDGWFDDLPDIGIYNFDNHQYVTCTPPEHLRHLPIADLELLAHIVAIHVWGKEWLEKSSMVLLITPHAFISSVTGSPAKTSGSEWPGFSRWPKSNSSFTGSPTGLAPTTTSSPTLYPGWDLKSTEIYFPNIAQNWGDYLKKGLSRMKCSTSVCNFLLGLLKKLHNEAQFLQCHAWAVSTKKTLSTEYKAFAAYCVLTDIVTLPISAYQITLYATWLISSGKIKSAASLAQYILAVRTLHRINHLDCPTPTQHAPLNHLIQGFKRLGQRPTKKTLPVTPVILLNLINSKPHDPLCAQQRAILTTYKALSLIYFLTMLRSSSLIDTTGTVDPRRILSWGNISRVQYGVIIRVHLSKTIQFGERVQSIPLAASPNPLFCPVAALNSLVQLYGAQNCKFNSPVFQIPSTSNQFAPVKRSEFDQFFKKRLAQMNADPSLYTLHGFRHGRLHECMLAEANQALVKVTSDHSNDAIMAYASVPPERRMRISAKMNISLDNYAAAHL